MKENGKYVWRTVRKGHLYGESRHMDRIFRNAKNRGDRKVCEDQQDGD